MVDMALVEDDGIGGFFASFLKPGYMFGYYLLYIIMCLVEVPVKKINSYLIQSKSQKNITFQLLKNITFQTKFHKFHL